MDILQKFITCYHFIITEAQMLSRPIKECLLFMVKMRYRYNRLNMFLALLFWKFRHE